MEIICPPTAIARESSEYSIPSRAMSASTSAALRNNSFAASKQLNRIADARGAPEAKINTAFALVSCIFLVTVCLAPIAQIFDIVVIWQIIGVIKALETK